MIGDGYQSDIAIDDITYTDETCWDCKLYVYIIILLDDSSMISYAATM